MSRYRKIDTRLWNDAKFRDLSDNAKLVFFMVLTHPNMTALGAMRATLPGLAAEIRWTAEAFHEAIGEVFEKGMAEHDEKACLIALPNFVKYNQPESPNVVKAWVAALDLLPESGLKFRVIARAQVVAEGMSEGFGKAFRDAFAKGMPYQEHEPEQKQKQETIEGKDSLRSSSSTASPMDVPENATSSTAKEGEQRLCQIVDDASDAYNAICAKPNGLMPKVTPAGRHARMGQTKRIITTARGICQQEYGSSTITRQFWDDYLAAIQADEFHSGRQGGGRGHESWTPDFEFLTQPKTMLKVFERAITEAQA